MTFHEWRKGKLPKKILDKFKTKEGKEAEKVYFSNHLKIAEARCKARCIALVQTAAKKTWQAAAWYLERRYSDEYSLKYKAEHSGEISGNIVINRPNNGKS